MNALLAANLTGTAAILFAVWRNHQKLVDQIDWTTHRQTRHLKGVINVSQQDTVNAVVSRLEKVRGEVTAASAALTAKVDALQAQIDAGVPAEDLDLTALTDVAQTLDDLNADAVDVPVDEPTEVPDEVPAEVVGDEIEDDDEPVDADAPADAQ